MGLGQYFIILLYLTTYPKCVYAQRSFHQLGLNKIYITSIVSFIQTKLRRMIRYLRLKDLKSKTVKPASPDDEDVLETAGKLIILVEDDLSCQQTSKDILIPNSFIHKGGDTSKSDSGKRLKLAYDFVSSIDSSGILSIFSWYETTSKVLN